MIRRVAVVCLLGIRAPLRSRLVAGLLILLAAVLILLPIGIKSDGTVAGDVRMLLTWMLGIAFGILCVSTMWAGCATISTDIEAGRHVLTAVAPVRPFEVWLGRWLGILITNAVLLSLVVIAIVVQLRIHGLSAEDTSVYRRLALDEQSVTTEVDEIYAQALRMGLIPEGAQEKDVRRSIEKDFKVAYLSVDPGMSRSWVFVLNPDDGDREIRVIFSFLSSYGAASGCEGVFTVSTSDGKPVAVRKIDGSDVGDMNLTIPQGAFSGQTLAHIVFQNTASQETGVSVLVSHFESMQMLVSDGGVLRNLMKCSVAMFSLLALLAAIGVSCGSLFSFPVATFAGSAIVLMMFLGSSGMVEEGAGHRHSHGEAVTPSAWSQAMDAFSKRLSVGVSAISQPFSDTEALDRLGDSIYIEPQKVSRTLLLTGVFFPLMLGLLGALALRRREY